MAGAFRVNGRDYPIPEDLTIGELCDAEMLFGVDFTAGGASGFRLAAAMLYIAIKRVDKTVTAEDIRALPPDTFTSVQEALDTSPLPTTGNSGESPEPSGEDSKTSTDTTQPPNGTGDPGLDTGSLSALKTSVA